MGISVFYLFLITEIITISIQHIHASFSFDKQLYYPIPTYNGSRELGNFY